MFYFLAELKDQLFIFNIFKYITFRAGMAGITTFLLSIIWGPRFIDMMRRRKIQELAKRDDAPALDKFQVTKEGTPTMGGVFIIGSILISVLLWGNLTNQFVLLTIFVCGALAVLGGVDDWIKLTQKGHRGIRARTKMFWQVLIAGLVGLYICVHPDVSTRMDIPFFKDVVIHLGVFYILWAILVIVGTSNAVNLTDGLDGLAIGCIMIVAPTLAILCYISGHMEFAEYLFIPYVAGTGELTVFCAAILGASLGFLWFNSYPATIFMGDVGSLALGGSLGTIALFIKKELWLFILGGVFVLEALSVILQVASFKLTGKRIFKMSPLHHHMQLSGWNESKIIVRFWIIGIIFALLTLTTLKIR